MCTMPSSNSDCMSLVYQLHSAVTIREVAEFKHRGKKGQERLMDVTLDSFSMDEADIQTHVPKKAL